MMDFILFDRAVPVANRLDVTVHLELEFAGFSLQLFGRSAAQYVKIEANGNVAIAIGGGAAETKFQRRLAGLLDAPDIDIKELTQFAELMKAEFPVDFAVMVGVERIAGWFVFGDVFGAVPVFKADDHDNVIVSTSVDLIGQNLGREYDPISYHDMIISGRICFPYTAYEGVSQCDPTTAILVSNGRAQAMDIRYRPQEIEPQDLVPAVAENLVHAIKSRVEGQAALVALSGGLDSRIVLAICRNYADTTAFSITQVPSRDDTLARLVSRARRVPHESFVLSAADFRGKSGLMLACCGSQNFWRHGHFLPMEEFFQSRRWTLLGGYGCNTIFEAYGHVHTTQRQIAKSEIPDEYKECLIDRWSAHAGNTRARFGLKASRLALVWPCTQRKAFAHFQVSRHLVATLEPLMTPPLAFAAKTMDPDRTRNVPAELFRMFCADERDIPVTAPLHPFGCNPSFDTSAGQRPAGWPNKSTLYPPVAGQGDGRLSRLMPEESYKRQLSAIEALCRQGSPSHLSEQGNGY